MNTFCKFLLVHRASKLLKIGCPDPKMVVLGNRTTANFADWWWQPTITIEGNFVDAFQEHILLSLVINRVEIMFKAYLYF
jgi:hypothetical protein